MVAVDAGLSYERTLGLKFHDANEELASPVVPGVSVSVCTIQLLANSEQHQLECARSIRHLPPSASHARLQVQAFENSDLTALKHHMSNYPRSVNELFQTTSNVAQA